MSFPNRGLFFANKDRTHPPVLFMDGVGGVLEQLQYSEDGSRVAVTYTQTQRSGFGRYLPGALEEVRSKPFPVSALLWAIGNTAPEALLLGRGHITLPVHSDGSVIMQDARTTECRCPHCDKPALGVNYLAFEKLQAENRSLKDHVRRCELQHRLDMDKLQRRNKDAANLVSAVKGVSMLDTERFVDNQEDKND